MMSKSIARVVFAALISLVIIAAAIPNVQARLEGVFQKSGANSSATTSMFARDQELKQETTNEQIPAPSEFNDFAPSDSSKDCSSDSSQDF